jgi:hypothetical protein
MGIHTDVCVDNNKYIWLGTDKVFDSFMFPFIQTDSGLDMGACLRC